MLPLRKVFWLKHFGKHAASVPWEQFKGAFEAEFGEQPVRSLEQLRGVLAQGGGGGGGGALPPPPPTTGGGGEGVKYKDHTSTAKYFKMLKMGLPRVAVELKMNAEGFDPKILDTPDAIVPGTGGGGGGGGGGSGGRSGGGARGSPAPQERG